MKRAFNVSQRIYFVKSIAKTQEMCRYLFYWRSQGFVLSVMVPIRIVFIDGITKSETFAINIENTYK